MRHRKRLNCPCVVKRLASGAEQWPSSQCLPASQTLQLTRGGFGAIKQLTVRLRHPVIKQNQSNLTINCIIDRMRLLVNSRRFLCRVKTAVENEMEVVLVKGFCRGRILLLWCGRSLASTAGLTSCKSRILLLWCGKA